jgi:hypothetical protein
VAQTVIRSGQVLDYASMAEIRAEMDLRERQLGRGIKYIRLSGPGPSPAAQTLYIANGPEVGYIWALRLLSVQVSSADTLIAYVTSSAPSTGLTPQRLISTFGASNLNQVATFGTAQAMLYGGEGVYLSAAAHDITAWHLTAWEVPSEMEWKLL